MRSIRFLVAVGVTIVALGTLGAAAARPTRAADTPRRCNGLAALCERRLDQVAFPATHNSMATAKDGFQNPSQDRTIAGQLAGGIRALLIDVYEATPTSDRVCTDPTPLKVEQIRRDQGQAALDQLLTIRAQQCPPAGGAESAVYLCHAFCELGATPFAATLRDVRTFLHRHPGVVVVMILEDYARLPQIRAAFTRARLDGMLVRHRSGQRWPTLGALARRGTRLVVFAQNQGGRAPGVLDAFSEMNETPYTFGAVADLSCAENRGPQRAPLFLLNHWITTPDARSAAAEANAFGVLEPRVERCASERQHLPNFVAVNFAEEGDLLRVVDGLNRR